MHDYDRIAVSPTKPGYRICQKCRERLPVASFDPDKRSPSGYHWKCRVCRRIGQAILRSK